MIQDLPLGKSPDGNGDIVAHVMSAPRRGANGLLGEIITYLVRPPQITTLVEFATPSERHRYEHRIIERMGMDVSDYDVLNIHRIGIDVPPSSVWDNMARWRPERGYWPNRIAHIVWQGPQFDRFDVFLFGRRNSILGLRKIFGLPFIPLFSAERHLWVDTPRPNGPDDGRFLVYRCTGGYPIGIFALYVRSSNHDLGERGATQLFFTVAFDFYGKKHWLALNAVRRVWQWVHNRVTAHALNRLKAHCEAEFARAEKAMAGAQNT